ncbi:MAG TPA: cation:proton antiporter [Candidatus Baltobacteraceae bacterium]|nr:cation:proton antiporter [Candidatus Baltobacteraceae bacterium]
MSVSHFTILLGSALAISIAAERLRLPAAVLLVASGALAAVLWHVRLPFSFGPALLFLFLPPLIFEAGWHLNLLELRKQWVRIFVLAFPGTLLGAFSVAAVLTAAGVLSFASALLLGAIIAATDPVAVVAVFRSVRVPPSLSTIVEAESLANDGVAVALYGIALVLAGAQSAPWVALISHGVLAIVLGAAVGAACAVPFWLALSISDNSEYEVAGTVALAYTSYLVAANLGWSGIFASASAAIALRLLLLRREHISHRHHVQVFWDAAAYMTNSIVFLASGLLIVPIRIFNEPFLILASLVVILLVRAALSRLVMREWSGSVTVFLAGMRGALPLALALALPHWVPGRAQIVDVVFATVLVTLVFQGSSLRWIVNRLSFPSKLAAQIPAAD